MKCTLCHGHRVVTSTVQERIPVGNDIVLVSIKIPTCQTCGERYYDRTTMRRLEELEDDLAARKHLLREVGKVLELVTP